MSEAVKEFGVSKGVGLGDAPEERVHHPFSPSTLQSLEACACYRGKNESHVRAVAGSRGHKVIESLEDDVRLSDDDAGNVTKCLDFYDRQVALFQEERTRAHSDYIDRAAKSDEDPAKLTKLEDWPPVKEAQEIYVPIDDLVFPDAKATTAGYTDKVLLSWNGKRGLITDWKLGYWAVESADNNLQGMAYTLGIFKAFPDLEEVTVCFFQPQLDLILTHTWKRSDIPAIYLRIQVIVARARAARERGTFETATPMVPVCNFCANLAVCPKVAEFACQVAKKYDPVSIPADINPSLLHDGKNTTLALRLASLVATWAKAFRQQTTARILVGDADMPDGYKIETRDGDREVIDVEKAKAVAVKYLTEDEFKSCQSVTLGSMETLIGDKAPRGSKGNTIQAFGNELLESGAVKRGEPYSFLRAINKKVT